LFDVDKNSDVFAAKDGTVFFASYVKNYQNLIIIKHNDGLLSVYGNLEKMSVKKNDPILKGEQIGTVSPATSKTLFFSIRNTKKALDPMPYIK
jgi:septal ring factor EnvC (AmiA/AmiB activator)